MPDICTRPTDLARAVTAVNSALATLRADPGDDAVDHDLREASAAIEHLHTGLTATVLRRLVSSIEDCHRNGLANSDLLDIRARSAARALRLDPTWGPG
jgi:hypothetical protein